MIDDTIPGKTGTGKSTLLETMIMQDIEAERDGRCLLDPHGDLVEKVVIYTGVEKERFNLFQYL
ncbi:MAG: hypothetical protein U0T81_09010 [Saprospiraceae bacterium]